MTKKLKPCPFCGDEAVIEQLDEDYNNEWRIYCRNSNGECKMQPCTRIYETQEDAIEAWNTRALTPAQEHAEELALLLFDLLFACLCGSLQEKQTLLDRAEALLSDIKLQELQEKVPALRKIKAQQEANHGK